VILDFRFAIMRAIPLLIDFIRGATLAIHNPQSKIQNREWDVMFGVIRWHKATNI
jgi:hypothetical protein